MMHAEFDIERNCKGLAVEEEQLQLINNVVECIQVSKVDFLNLCLIENVLSDELKVILVKQF